MSPSGPRLRAGRSTGIVSMLVVLAVALGIWLVSGGDPGSSTGQPGPTSSPVALPSGVATPDGVDPLSGLPYVRLDDLPTQAQSTVHLIDSGGPYPYEQDGATFGNYEALLPLRDHAYYQEFTVPTPGSPDRGARRIIVGQDRELYWTADHYATFQRILR